MLSKMLDWMFSVPFSLSCMYLCECGFVVYEYKNEFVFVNRSFVMSGDRNKSLRRALHKELTKVEWRIVGMELIRRRCFDWFGLIWYDFVQRIVDQYDMQQAVRFLLSSYNMKEANPVKALFAGMIFCKTRPSIEFVEVTSAWSATPTITHSQTMRTLPLPSSHKLNASNLPKDPIEFWKLVATKHKTAGTELELGRTSSIRDPVRHKVPPVRRVHVRSVINSNAKPLLIDLYVCADNRQDYEFRSSTIILKAGDNLRKDCACMSVFKKINSLWDASALNYDGKNVKVLTYKVVPMTVDLGCIELIYWMYSIATY